MYNQTSNFKIGYFRKILLNDVNNLLNVYLLLFSIYV